MIDGGPKRERQTGKQRFRFANAHSQAEISTADALPTAGRGRGARAAMPPKGAKGGKSKGAKGSNNEPLPMPAAATGEPLGFKRSVLASEREVVVVVVAAVVR